jgi:hypothetical protein
MEVRGREKIEPRSLHVDIRDIAHDPSKWIEGLGAEAEDRIKSEEEFMAHYRKSAETIFRRRAQARVAARHLEKIGIYDPEFMDTVGRRKFRNPETGNQVIFVSLPPREQAKIYQTWRQRAQYEQGQEEEKRQQTTEQRKSEPDPSGAVGRWKPGEWADVGMLPAGSVVRHESTGEEWEILKPRFDKATARNLATGKQKVLYDTDDHTLVRGPAAESSKNRRKESGN